MHSRARLKFFFSAAVVLQVCMMMSILTCDDENPTSLSEEQTWSLTVNVTDGYSGNRLSGVRVSYTDKDDLDTFNITNGQGQVIIENLEDATQNFNISYTDSSMIKYTDALLTLTSISDTSGLKKLTDRIENVKLFPLSGSITGKILAQRHDLAPKVPVSALTVRLSYSNTDLSSGTSFQALTDSTGTFKFSSLPLSSGLSMIIPNISIGGIDFKVDSIPAPVLQHKVTVPAGSIFMHPIGIDRFKLTGTLPASISPNQTITLLYSDTLDTVSYAVFEGMKGSKTVQAKKVISGTTFSITPSVSLTPNSSYYLVVNAFGKAGGGQISKDSLSVSESGTIDIVSSNVLDANHQVISGLGLTDSMQFTFKSPVATGSASVSKGDIVIVTDVVIKANTLIIKPKGIWEPGTYSVKVSATLTDSTTTLFTFNITTVGGLDFVSSNIYNPQTKTAINGLKFNDTIKVVANKTITSAQATLSVVNPSTPVQVTVVATGATAFVIPTDKLNSATAYAFSITVFTDKGESKSFTIPSAAPFTTANSDFYPVADNIRNAGDPAKPILTFPPNGVIIIKMSAEVKSATAQISAGENAFASAVVVKADSIVITPSTNFKEGTAYSLQVSAQSKSGAFYTEKNFVTGFLVKNTFIPVSSNVRIDNSPTQPVLDFAPNGKIVIIMSDSVKTCTAALLSGTTVVGSKVSLSKDTIKIIPDDLLSSSNPYTVSLGAESRTGLTFHAETEPYFVTGLRVRTNLVRVVASNVQSADGIGLTDIPVTVTPYYVLSSTPNQQSLAVTIYSGKDTVNSTVSVKGDTVVIKPVLNLGSGRQYKVTIKGKTTASDPIDIDLTGDNKVFTTRSAVIIAASNMKDVNGNPVSSLSPTTELWVKFSRPLSTDLTKHQLGGGIGVTAVYHYGATNNNVIVRVNVDTLFAKFQQNALPGEGDSISLRGMTILFDDGTTLGPDVVNLKAYILKRPAPYVLATNGIVNNAVVDTFNTLGEAWIVSSLPFISVDAVKNGPDGLSNVTAQNLVLSNVRTHGDTIFFKPAVRLSYDTEFQVAFNVTLKDSSKYTGTGLKLRWKTEKGAYLISANDMVTGFQTYRPFTLTGDSLVLVFNKSIDITKSFSISGLVPRMAYTWSNGNKQLTVKPQDTLKSKPYTFTGGYALTDVAQYGAITISLTTTEGEVWTAKATNSPAIFKNARPAIAIHTVMGIEVLNTTLKVSNANKSQYYNNTENRKMSELISANLVAQNDSVGRGDTLKVFFSTEVNTAAIVAITGMVRLTTGTGPGATNIPFTISYASSNKTVQIKPNALLAPATSYTLTLTNVKGLGYESDDTNGDISYTFAFKTRPRSLTAAQVLLYSDTAKTPGVLGKRMGYSGSLNDAYGVAGAGGSFNTADVPAQNTVRIMYYEAAFRSDAVMDTVSHYQYSVLGRDNVTWYLLKNLRPSHHYSLTAQDSLRRDTLDLRTVSTEDLDINNAKVGALLRIGKTPNHQNDTSIFNYGAALNVRIRPVLSADNQWDAGDVVGSWSATLTFSDNIAPCDTDYVAKPSDLDYLQNVSRGGVSITVTSCPMNRNLLSDAVYVFNFKFPEDMDTTIKPVITTWYGGTTPTTTITVDNGNSYWDGNVYSYKLTMKIPGGVDLSTAGPHKPYYAISIAGMKDASGVAIQTWGSGSGINGTPLPITNTQGTANMRGFTAY
jgi:hypothetical protein